MRTTAWVALMAVLAVIIVILAYFVFVTPTPGAATGTATGATTTENGTATGTATGTTTTQPLSKRVVVTAPARNATVEKTFVVSGNAPGPWYFEASFPIKVLDKDGNVLMNTHADAQGDWMTTEQVTFTATITIANYSGPATLVLMKDNPSGLPEHDDSIEMPIVIK